MKNILFALTLVLISACNADLKDDFEAANEEEIQTYLAANNLIAQKTSSGLYYIITDPGTGAFPTATDNVRVAYRGYFTNGEVFDESGPLGISFGLQQVIEGWTEGIPYLREGGSGVLLIPARLAYGNKSVGGIPGGAVLVFDVTLIEIN